MRVSCDWIDALRSVSVEVFVPVTVGVKVHRELNQFFNTFWAVVVFCNVCKAEAVYEIAEADTSLAVPCMIDVFKIFILLINARHSHFKHC